MKFSQVIGQKNIVKSLQNSILNDMVSHAYIFEGPDGIGKKTIASIFAETLLCEKSGIEPCEICKSCIEFQSGNHPDIKFIDSEGKKIGVDSIRKIHKDIYIKPYQSNKKIYIIKHSEKMTAQAQNCLLKIFEEPPKYGLIILLTANSSLLLKTIISRAVLLKFEPHTYKEISSFIKYRYPELNNQISFIAGFSGGIIGRAIDIAESEQFNNIRKDIAKIIMMLIDGTEIDILDCVDFFINNKNDYQYIFEFIILWLRDVIFLKELNSTQRIINIDMLNELKRFSQKVSSFSAVKILGFVLDIKQKIDENANYTLAIELILLKSWEEVHGKRSRSSF